MNNARTFDRLIERVRAVAAELPDRRTGDNTVYSMADIALAAFSVFFTQCPSFLSYQQAMEQTRGRNNARSLFQIQRIPSDNHIRQPLDPVEPSHLFSLFDDLPQALPVGRAAAWAITGRACSPSRPTNPIFISPARRIGISSGAWNLPFLHCCRC